MGDAGSNSSSAGSGHPPPTPAAPGTAANATTTMPPVWHPRHCLLGLVASAALLVLGFVAVHPNVRPTVMYGVLNAKKGDMPAPLRPVLLTDNASFHRELLEFVWQPLEPLEPPEQQAKDVEAEAEAEAEATAVVVTRRGKGVADCDLVVKGHELQAFDQAAEAHACLRNKSIVLVGDSLTRYQYLNLVQFLENGQWWNPDPQLECEFQWGGGERSSSWPLFYNVGRFLGNWAKHPDGMIHSSFFLPLFPSPPHHVQGTNARFNGREVCDCYREEPAGRKGNIENRYYYNEEVDVWVSFFQWFNADTGHLGHDLAWLNVALPPSRRRRAAGLRGGKNKQQQAGRPRGQTGCAPGACDMPSHWAHDVYGLFEHVIPQLHPDVLMFNSGHWGRLPGAYDLDRLTQAAKAAVRTSGGRVIYKTTTAPNGPAPFVPEDDLAAHFQAAGVSILDAGAITFGARDVEAELGQAQGTHLYWDMLHFYSPVYAGLNRMLLNYVCPVMQAA